MNAAFRILVQEWTINQEAGVALLEHMESQVKLQQPQFLYYL